MSARQFGIFTGLITFLTLRRHQSNEFIHSSTAVHWNIRHCRKCAPDSFNYAHVSTWKTFLNGKFTKILPTANATEIPTRSSSNAHVTVMVLTQVDDRRQRRVMSTGRFGRFGSTPGLFVGITFCHRHTHSYTPRLQWQHVL